jgi:hypothetical protein
MSHFNKKQFAEDLARGQDNEKRIAQIIKKKYPYARTIIRDGYFKAWDIKVENPDTTVEVKQDDRAKETGNLIFETEMEGKPSGITTTKAEWWVQTVADKDYWFSVEELREFLAKYPIVKRKIKGGLTGRCHLVPINHIEAYLQSRQT